ncbi:MAG: SDR family oxidoreductase [Syntrophobacteraceae bacterium]
MDKSLFGKTAIVTGASSGIGYATAMSLARAGAAVVLQARREERLQELASEIKALGGKALVAAGDAKKTSDIDAMLAKTLQWKDGGSKVDIVIVNAGRGLAGGVLTSDESAWREVFELNVLAAAHLMRIAASRMIAQKGGDIVILGSNVGRNVSPFSGFYGSSKFAVGALAEALRREVCAHGVRVSLVMPGIVLSEFQKVAGYTEENFGKGVAQFGKLLEPSDIAAGIVWLLTLPAHVNVNEIMIRPTGQNYP